MKNSVKHITFVLFCVLASMLLFGTTAFAYIDASAVTILIQAVAGVAIAVGAAVGIFWRRAKKKVSDKLGIDENRNKEVESDEIVVDDATSSDDKENN